jgi:type IV pilus assembly protein PilQ
MTSGYKTKQILAVLLLALAIVAAPLLRADESADPATPIKNLQFQAAEIRSVLTFLADYGVVNVVIAPDVEGTVTIKLRDVKWRDAMDIIGRTYDLAIIDEKSGYIRVARAEDYRKERSEQQKHLQETQQLVPLVTQIVKISNSTSDDMVEAVKSLMTTRGKATSDPRSNSIILQEIPDNLEAVIGYINELDKPARQIKISAQLLEISSKGLEELGVNWKATGTYTTDDGGRSYTQTGEVLGDRSADVLGRYSVTAMQRGWNVEALVEAIVSDGKGKIIAHPEITTLENNEARIQMGQKVPIKQFDESGNVVIKFEEVGTILKVTPHITAENQILMHLIPERSTYQFDPNGVIINTNNAETRVIVENGQTAVIGGLTTQDESTNEVGVPILKDIPLVGILFKFKTKSTETRDLVIFVTPTIVEADLAMGG